MFAKVRTQCSLYRKLYSGRHLTWRHDGVLELGALSVCTYFVFVIVGQFSKRQQNIDKLAGAEKHEEFRRSLL